MSYPAVDSVPKIARLPVMLVLAGVTACGTNPVEAPIPVPSEGVVAGAQMATDVQFSLDLRKSAPISPYVYGINVGYMQGWHGAELPENYTIGRIGGNRLSAYNWENNASNAGSDWRYQNDAFMSESETPGEGVRKLVQESFDRGAGVIVTVPMLGHVAADKDGPVGVDPGELAARLSSRFKESRARKGSAFSAQPNVNDEAVYQDEFVWWLNRTFPRASTDRAAPILYTLDNEPDIWHRTHEQVRGNSKLTYDELVSRTIEYSAAIKDVVPGATVMGPGLTNYTGITTLGRWPDPDPVAGTAEFLSYYLEKMKAAERASGRRLLDVVDLHWYTEVVVEGRRLTDDRAPQTPAVVEARVQAPRSLWDATYSEGSWVNDVARGPIALLPRLRDRIAAHYPGTKVAISEYYYGGGGHISGAIAQADALGIFGREGVYAANLWPAAVVDAYGGDGKRAYAYVLGAFEMFRSYDGNGGSFGNTSIGATTTDPRRTSVYASVDSGRNDRVVVVAINKSTESVSAAITLDHPRGLRRAEIYALVDGSPIPKRQADLEAVTANTFVYRMPPLSVTTLVLK